MKVCEKCRVEIDGSYGSGRFCSRVCANSRTFSEEAKNKKSIKSKISNEKRIKSLEDSGKTFIFEKYIDDNGLIKKKIKYVEKVIFKCSICLNVISDKNKTGFCQKCLNNTPEGKECWSNLHSSSKFRRVNRNAIHYNGVALDSSWELALAQRLDSLNIKWIRPQPLEYYIENKKHFYYPDFYLIDYCLFIEVKNSFLFENDPKVKILIETYPEIIFLTSKESCQSFFISRFESE